MKHISHQALELGERNKPNGAKVKTSDIENLETAEDIPEDLPIGEGISLLKVDEKKFMGHLKDPGQKHKSMKAALLVGSGTLKTSTKGGRTFEKISSEPKSIGPSRFKQEIKAKLVKVTIPVINKPLCHDIDDFDQCQYDLSDLLKTDDKSEQIEKSGVSLLEETLVKKKVDNQKKNIDDKKLNLVPMHCMNLYKNDLASMRILRNKNKKFGDLRAHKSYHSSRFLTTTKSILKPCSYDIDHSSMKRANSKSVTPEKNVKFNKKKLVYKFKKEKNRNCFDNRFARSRSNSHKRRGKGKKRRKKTKVNLKWFAKDSEGNTPGNQDEARNKTKSFFYAQH